MGIVKKIDVDKDLRPKLSFFGFFYKHIIRLEYTVRIFLLLSEAHSKSASRWKCLLDGAVDHETIICMGKKYSLILPKLNFCVYDKPPSCL